jgi:site-specific DNA-cytosine methylase
VAAGVEIELDFADEWQAQHPEATLVQSDIRALHTSELPEFDVLIGGIPCTCHSNLGRAKKGLAGKPELGDNGDLFLPVVTLISERMPAAAVVFENVPAFGTSLAGELLVSHLRRIGYHVTIEVLRPNEDWAELEDRQRWLLVGTLAKAFTLQVPRERCCTPASAMLDPPDPTQDRADAERIARTITALRAPATASDSPKSPATRRGWRSFPRATTRSTPDRLCRRPSACDCCGRRKSSGSTATPCLPGATQRRCRFWGRGCRRGCFVRCFGNWPIILWARRQ